MPLNSVAVTRQSVTNNSEFCYCVTQTERDDFLLTYSGEIGYPIRTGR